VCECATRACVRAQTIRHKIAEMARKVESTHAMIEQLAFMMQSVRACTRSELTAMPSALR
jgi:hypothetical protein